MKLAKFLASGYFNLIGGLMIGLSIPIGHYGIIVRENPMMDFIVFAPIGLVLIGISYYYKFIDKE